MNKLQLPDTASATSTLTLDGDNEEERNSAMGYQQTLMVSKLSNHTIKDQFTRLLLCRNPSNFEKNYI